MDLELANFSEGTITPGTSLPNLGWDVLYEANQIPESATPAWTQVNLNPDTETAAGGIFTMAETLPVINGPYYTSSDANISNTTGFTIQARLKVITTTNSTGLDCILGVELGAGQPWGYLYFTQTNIQINEGVVTPATYTMDTTDDFHIYHFTVKNSVCRAYVDGIYRITATLNNIAGSGTLAEFGTFASGAYEHQWDYVYFSAGGAFAP